MPSTFSRSMASLNADSFRRPLILIVGASLLLGLWGLWMGLGEVTLTEVSAQARLEVSTQAFAVQAPVSGLVVATPLRLGQNIQAKDLVLELDATDLKLELEEQRSRLSGLRGELASLSAVIAAEEKVLEVTVSAAATAVQEAEARRREEDIQAKYRRDRAGRLGTLGQGGQVAAMDVLAARSEADQTSAAVDRLAISVEHLRKTGRATRNERLARLASLRQEAVSLHAEVGTAAASIKRLEHAVSRRRILAPVTGRVARLVPMQTGTYLGEGGDICTIVPPGQVKAVAYFAPQAMGRIRPGQEARLRLDGFPWAQYGSLPAVVSRVAGELHQGMLRVEMRPRPRPDSAIPLQHGLPGSVELFTERLSPLLLLLRTAGRMVTAVPTAQPGPTAQPSGGAQ